MSGLLWVQGEDGQGRQTKQGHGQGLGAGALVLGTAKWWQLPTVKQGEQSIPGGHSLEWTASQGPCKAFVAFETTTKCALSQVFVKY